MIKFIYRDKKTPIHRLHPVCKLVWVFAIVIGSIILNDPILLSMLFIVTLPFVIIGRVTKEWIPFIKFAIFLSLFIITINFLSQGLALESLTFSIIMCLRLLVVLSAFAILSLTINPDHLFQMFLSLKIPYRTVLTTSVAARFIPSLLNDAENISIGFKTRGYQISGGFFEKVKKRAAIIPPLLSNSLERSVQFAEALECRGFGSKGKKTFYSRMKVTRKDLLFIILSTSPLFLLFQSQVIF